MSGLARFTTPGPTRRVPRTTPTAPGRSAEADAGPDRTGTGVGIAEGAALPPALATVIGTRPAPSPGEACELCAAPVDLDHRHVVDLERRSLLCSCRGCALLFERTVGAVDAGRYRTVPDRFARIEPFTLPEQAWAALQIPVDMAFVVRNSQLDRTVAFYPSPGGATESELPLEAWRDIVAANPVLTQVADDVEAVLLRTGDTGDTGPDCLIVPVDRCYELVGTLRLHWRGFDGGQEVREHIAAFFADADRRARTLRPSNGEGAGR